MSEHRVIVVFGGDGNEHRVSVASAQNVTANLPGARLWYWSLDGPVLELSAHELSSFERPFERDFDPSSSTEWTTLSEALRDDSASGAIFLLGLHGDPVSPRRDAVLDLRLGAHHVRLDGSLRRRVDGDGS